MSLILSFFTSFVNCHFHSPTPLISIAWTHEFPQNYFFQLSSLSFSRSPIHLHAYIYLIVWIFMKRKISRTNEAKFNEICCPHLRLPILMWAALELKRRRIEKFKWEACIHVHHHCTTSQTHIKLRSQMSNFSKYLLRCNTHRERTSGWWWTRWSVCSPIKVASTDFDAWFPLSLNYSLSLSPLLNKLFSKLNSMSSLRLFHFFFLRFLKDLWSAQARQQEIRSADEPGGGKAWHVCPSPAIVPCVCLGVCCFCFVLNFWRTWLLCVCIS